MPPSAARQSSGRERPRPRPVAARAEPGRDLEDRLAKRTAREAAEARRTLAQVERREAERQAAHVRAKSRLRFLALVLVLVVTAVLVALVMFRAMALILG